jgi:hypothetical protein
MLLSTYHLKGKARLWYELFKESTKFVTWKIMKTGLLSLWEAKSYYCMPSMPSKKRCWQLIILKAKNNCGTSSLRRAHSL